MLPILPSHIRARNASTLLIAGWSMAWSICTAVNAILYADLNLPVPAVSVPVTGIQWCDFSQAVLFCANIGSLGAQLTLLRRLKIIAAVKTVTPTARSAFSRYGLEVLLGVALPIVLLALHVVVQGHRIDIIEGYGCTMPQYVNSLPYIFLYSLWPPILALVSLFYGGELDGWTFRISPRVFTSYCAFLRSHGGQKLLATSPSVCDGSGVPFYWDVQGSLHSPAIAPLRHAPIHASTHHVVFHSIFRPLSHASLE